MRQRVDQQRIEYFLQRLGQQFRKPGRVYLVGGTTMVYEGLRQQTLDIDLALEIADVLSLLQNDRLEMAKLVDYFNEILLRYATDSLKQDPIEFQRKFAILLEMWRDISSVN